MVSREPILLAVAADGREFAGFANRRPADIDARWGYWSEWAAGKTLMAADGIGREAAKRAVRAALAKHEASAVISIGYVGALRPGWAVGDVFVADRVLLPEAGVEYAVNLPVFEGEPDNVRGGALATIDRIAGTVADKRRLADRGADAVDMEAFEVAEQAQSHGLPFFCIRVVSDDAETDLGFDFDRARRPDGTVSGAAVVAQAGLNPSRWRKLFALKRNGELAARNLAQFLLQCRFPLESNR
jgi:nucleoside phosphorylase